jgi:hypothetical protein
VRGVVGFALASAALLAWGGWGLLVEPAVEQPVQCPHEAHRGLETPKPERGG